LINGVSVTPLEWWDARWIRDHVGRPLREASLPLIESVTPAETRDDAGPAARRRRAARSR